MKVLIILTSHDKLGDTGKKTGFWLDEFAAPYYTLLDAGAEITLASPDGGEAPRAPQSEAHDAIAGYTRGLKRDDAAQRAIGRTTKLAKIDAYKFDAIFIVGGHGPLWDLAENDDCQRLVGTFLAEDRPLASAEAAARELLQLIDSRYSLRSAAA